MMNDIIADGLTRIRNAAMRGLEVTQLNHSKLMEAVLKVFEDKGYIESFKVIEDGNKKFINVTLKYDENGNSVLPDIAVWNILYSLIIFPASCSVSLTFFSLSISNDDFRPDSGLSRLR